MSSTLAALAALSPFLVGAGGILAYLVAKLLPPEKLRWTGAFSAAWLGVVFLVLALAGATASYGEVPFLGPILQPSPLGVAFGLLVTFLGVAAALWSLGRLDPRGPLQLYYPLLLFALGGSGGGLHPGPLHPLRLGGALGHPLLCPRRVPPGR